MRGRRVAGAQPAAPATPSAQPNEALDLLRQIHADMAAVRRALAARAGQANDHTEEPNG